MQRILAFDDPPGPAEQAATATEPEQEFERVVGKRQIAAITFLVLVIVAVCSGASYLAGKATSQREDPAQPLIRLEEAPAQIPMLEATIVPPASAPASPSAPRPAASIPAPAAAAAEAPVFGSPVPKAVYIQVGAVEKGVAIVIAEGLRKHALNSFVAAGPNEKVYRVLIGPFADAQGYQQAQRVVDQIGLTSFARRYQQQ